MGEGAGGEESGMFRNAYQRGLLSIFYSIGQKPLLIWRANCDGLGGLIRRLMDEDLKSLVLDIQGASVTTAYIECPPNRNETLGIRMPVFVIIFKNMARTFSFDIEVVGQTGFARHFRGSNCVPDTIIKQSYTVIPLKLHSGWNTVILDLQRLMKYCYNENLLRINRVRIHANCRLRRCFFSDRIYDESELPAAYKIKVKTSN